MMLDYASATLSPEYEIVGAFPDGHAALEAVGELQPDVIVLDISMPGMNGLEVAGRLRRAGCSTPIVFLTVHDDEGTVQ
jgi:CheY-like chemotaxis protein